MWLSSFSFDSAADKVAAFLADSGKQTVVKLGNENLIAAVALKHFIYWLKVKNGFPLVIILFILITCSLDYVLIL